MNRTLTYPIHVQFTKEIEENGKLPFLDCLVIRDNNKIRITVYRKPTHTDRLLDQSSYNPTSHKAATIKTLTRRAQLVCDSPDSLLDETRNLECVFQKNNYNPDFIKLNTHRNTEPDETTNNPTPVTTATIPYIKGTFETSPDLTALRHLCSSQTYHNFTTHTDQGQRPTSRQTGSGVQNQVYWLSSYLYWGDWQKLEDKTDGTQTGDQERWYQESHFWTPSTN